MKELANMFGSSLTTAPSERLIDDERREPSLIPVGARVFRQDSMVSQGATPAGTVDFEFKGKRHFPGANLHWKTTIPGLSRLAELDRLVSSGRALQYKRFLDDFPVFPLSNNWRDTGTGGSSSDPRVYVVQTVTRESLQRCLLMTTDPGDLVLDPTCGSGTTAFVAEQWGRRWITCDTSRVPLALARQRLLTATFDYYKLKDEQRGPAGGFVYERRQNQKGEEVGGIVPHITLKSIANNEPPGEEVLVDRPEVPRRAWCA